MTFESNEHSNEIEDSWSVQFSFYHEGLISGHDKHF